MRRAVMTGGRDWPFHARPAMRASLHAFHRAGVDRLAQGGARGADTFAAEIWIELNGDLGNYDADWHPNGIYDRGAGHRRNREMLAAEQPDILLAYPDEKSRGTWHCVAEALRMGIVTAVLMPWASTRHDAVKAAFAGVTRYAPDIVPRITYLLHDPDPHLYLGTAEQVETTWSFMQRPV